MILSKKLNFIREISGLSYEEFALKLNCSKEEVEQWEKDQTNPSFEIIKKISKNFDISLDYLAEDKIMTASDKNWVKKIGKYEEYLLTKSECDQYFNEAKEFLDKYNCSYNVKILPHMKKDKIQFGVFKIVNNKLELSKKLLFKNKEFNLIKEIYNTDIDLYEAIESDSKELIDLAFKKYDLMKETALNSKLSDKEVREKTKREEYFENNNIHTALQHLDGNLENYYYIIVNLIERGAYFFRQEVEGHEITITYNVKDDSKTSFIYRVAKDMLKLLSKD